ncbi:hypothetical protein NUW54_g10906 [Trametes sanguinea]|uniref:Uncharacterized protein n=1 Tax=Trametes sanguinea TaxID=158606 RepID=A0ACC1NQJ0_9APHY|nr:hypothetical protein NUW54_g10906 [Trametes sanguinea]
MSSTSPGPDRPVSTSTLATPGPTDPSEMRTTTALPDTALRPSPAAPALTDIPTTTSNSSASGGTLPDPTARLSVSPEDTSGPLSTAGIAGADLIMLDEDGCVMSIKSDRLWTFPCDGYAESEDFQRHQKLCCRSGEASSAFLEAGELACRDRGALDIAVLRAHHR